MDYPISVPGVGLVGGKFVDENPATGQQGSLIPAAWGNAVTEEIKNVLISAGLVPSELALDQLAKALLRDPTTVLRGMPFAASQVDADAGVSPSKMLTPALMSRALGVGQIQKNLTTARLIGVTYTNTTMRPIVAAIYCVRNAEAGLSPLVITVDGIHAFMSTQEPGNGNGGSVFVPPGSTYSVIAAKYTLQAWLEFRT